MKNQEPDEHLKAITKAVASGSWHHSAIYLCARKNYPDNFEAFLNDVRVRTKAWNEGRKDEAFWVEGGRGD